MIKIVRSIFNVYLSGFSGVTKSCINAILVGLINSIVNGITGFLTIYLVNNLHLSVFKAGWIVAAYSAGRVAGGMSVSKISEFFDDNLIGSLSLFIRAIIFFILIKVSAFYALIGLLFVFGFTNYCFKITNSALILSLSHGDHAIRHRLINMMYTTTEIALGISAVLISVLAKYNFQLIFFLSAIILIISTLYYFICCKQNKIIFNVKNSMIQSDDDNYNTSNHNFFYMATSLFFIGLVFSQFTSTYPLYVNQLFPLTGIKLVGALFAFNSLIIIFFQIPINHFLEKTNKMYLIGISGFLIGFAMWILNFSDLLAMFIFSCVVMSLGEISFFTSTQLYFYDKGLNKTKSLANYQVITSMSAIMGPIIGSAIYEYYGGPVIWNICGVIAVTNMLFFIYLESKKLIVKQADV